MASAQPLAPILAPSTPQTAEEWRRVARTYRESHVEGKREFLDRYADPSTWSSPESRAEAEHLEVVRLRGENAELRATICALEAERAHRELGELVPQVEDAATRLERVSA